MSSDDLVKWFSNARRIVIVGIGNPLRRDDNVGVEIVKGLEGKVQKSVLLIKSETVPESYIEPILEFNPSHILILDAALFGLAPGAIKLMEVSEVKTTAISTHALPLQIFCKYLAETIEAKIALLLIQPGDTNFGEGLTRELRLARKKLVNDLAKIIKGLI